jgi:hypothetical protein
MSEVWPYMDLCVHVLYMIVVCNCVQVFNRPVGCVYSACSTFLLSSFVYVFCTGWVFPGWFLAPGDANVWTCQIKKNAHSCTYWTAHADNWFSYSPQWRLNQCESTCLPVPYDVLWNLVHSLCWFWHSVPSHIAIHYTYKKAPSKPYSMHNTVDPLKCV